LWRKRNEIPSDATLDMRRRVELTGLSGSPPESILTTSLRSNVGLKLSV
jgi:hypothetical protein